MLTAVCANIAVFPVSALYFGYTSVLAPLATALLAVPCETAMICAGLSLITAKIALLAKPPLFLAGICAKFAVAVTGLAGKTKMPLIDVGDRLCVVLFTLVLCSLALLALNRETRTKTAISAVTALVCTTTVFVGARNIAAYSRPAIIIPVTDDSSCILLKDGTDVTVIGAGEQLSAYSLSRAFAKALRFGADRLVIPRDSATESGGADAVVAGFDIGEVIVPDENGCLRSQFSTKKCGVEVLTNDSFSGCLITCGKKQVLIVFYPGSDTDRMPASWRNADILIARAAIPFGMEADFSGEVYIMNESFTEIRKIVL